MMTPQEIFEYKQNWKPGYIVKLHSDLVNEGKTWCRKHLQRHEWSMSDWTDVYEHTFHFEYLADAQQFEKQWPDFANQGNNT